jgi:DNA-binding transcriptional regulator YdaS (Cro superfamily)
VHHRHGVAIEVAVGGQILRDDLAPFAKADEDVLPDRNVALASPQPTS